MLIKVATQEHTQACSHLAVESAMTWAIRLCKMGAALAEAATRPTNAIESLTIMKIDFWNKKLKLEDVYC